jgi:hypothetical protein
MGLNSLLSVFFKQKHHGEHQVKLKKIAYLRILFIFLKKVYSVN